MNKFPVYKNASPIIIKAGFLLFLFLVIRSQLNGQVYERKDLAFQKAKVENKPIFLIFSGSDWCLPCIKFDKEVLSTSEFQEFAQEYLVLLKADFPQRKEQDKTLIKQNEDLAEAYNPQGYFPHLVLLDKNGLVVTRFNYINQGVSDFIDGFDPYLENSIMQSVKKEAYLMGSNFEITIVDSSIEKGWLMIEESISEIKRIEDLISSWNDLSQTFKVNANAGVSPVKVDQEVYDLVERSLAISKLSNGAFDITFRGLSNLYTFDGEEHKLPDQQLISAALTNVGFQHIELQPERIVYVDKKGVSIGFGAIGKGFAADRTKKLMIEKGVLGGVINASGDLTVWGQQADGKPWKVGIANPMDKEEILFWMPVENKSVATSGDYEKYFESDGVRCSHIINPLTGYPTTGLMSVTVFSSSAELSDALATAVFVMGVKAGLDLINQMQDISCIIIEDLDHIHFSDGLKIYDTKTSNRVEK
jgi:thiamine biosynthesis lipoprotein